MIAVIALLLFSLFVTLFASFGIGLPVFQGLTVVAVFILWRKIEGRSDPHQ